MTVPTFLIKLLLPSSSRKHSREIGMLRNTRDNEILMNYTMIQEIWRHSQRFWEPKELRKVRAKNHCNQHQNLTFNEKAWSKVQTVGSVLCLLKAWQFRVISPRRCICKKSLTKRNFRAGSWISEQKFAQRVVTKGKGLNSYTERKTGKCFQRKTIESCSKRDNCSFLHTHATGHRETVWKEVGDERKSHLEQASSSVPKVKEQTDVKSSDSLKAGPTTRVRKSLVCGWQDEKVRRVSIGIIPCVVVTSLETDALVAFVAYIDMLMVRSNLSARSRKEGTQGAVAVLREKKSPRLHLKNSDPINSTLRKAGELGLNAPAGHTMKFSGRTWYELIFGKEKGNLEALSRKVNLMSEILARPFLRRNTWGNLTTSRLYQDTKRSFVYCVFGSFNAQCWARRFELRYNGYFGKVQNHHQQLTAGGSSANKRVSTSFLFMISICS